MENNLKKEDRKFLKSLERKFHSTGKISSGVYREGLIDIYNEEKISRHELEKVLDIVKENNGLFFMPIRGPFGFYPCFQVSEINTPLPGIKETQYLLRFSKGQLPEDYSFDSLKKEFSNEENLRKAQFAGATFKMNECSYDY